MIGDVSLPENCEIIVTSAKLVIGPSVSVIIITFAPRDLHSLMLASIRGKVSSEGATAITGVPSSIKAIGPCFSSPPGYARQGRQSPSFSGLPP